MSKPLIPGLIVILSTTSINARVYAGGGFIGPTVCTIYETSSMMKKSYNCNVAEAGDIHEIYVRVSLPNNTSAESTVYNDLVYGNKSRIHLKNIISVFAYPPYKNMGRMCAMLTLNKLLCYR